MKEWKKYFITLERLEHFQPNLAHILLTTYKETYKEHFIQIVTFAPLGAELFRGEN
jgi:hypothetical protein